MSRPVINLDGPKTVIGAAAVGEEVARAMAEAARGNVVMAERLDAAGRELAELAAAEAACLTHCSSASLAIMAAALVTGGDLALARALPRRPRGRPIGIVMQKAHDVDFGAMTSQMLRLGGARPIEVGASNRCSAELFASALADPAAVGALFVFHQAVRGAPDLVGLAEAAWAARQAGKPLIVDAAGEADWAAPLDAGAALVAWSCQKEMAGPTAGVIAGEARWIAACRAQEAGIGRAMKPSKEAVAGALAAARSWADRGEAKARARAKLERLEAALAGGPWRAERIADPLGRPASRLRLRLASAPASDLGSTPKRALLAGEPAIAIDGGAKPGDPLLANPRWASEEEIDLAANALNAYGAKISSCAE